MFSKLWEDRQAIFALLFAYYNFCPVHSTIGRTPAMAAGFTGHVWSVKELVERIGKAWSE